MMNDLKERFQEVFQQPADSVFSAPGRVELGGNHTDHQHGLVLAAAVDLDTKAAVRANGTGVIRIISEGHTDSEVDLGDLSVHPEEKGTSASLVRGICAGLKNRGGRVHGFDAFVTSRVLTGGGLSSSASFEILIGTVLNSLFNGNAFTPLDLALIGQFAENRYYGKPSGLLDQMTCASGGVVTIDFKDTMQPEVKKMDLDLRNFGYALCIIDTGADHRDLTEDYAAIVAELKELCAVFGKEVLREIPEEEFYRHIPEVRKAAGDRALLRAIHIYEENRRVVRETEALVRGDFSAYLREVRASGRSSWEYLQNVIPCGRTRRQEMAAVLALTAHLLGEEGASRVQGGGFAGSVQAYVPLDKLSAFQESIGSYLGPDKCTAVAFRAAGGICVDGAENGPEKPEK